MPAKKMERNKYLASRIREVFHNGTWIANTNYKDQLTGLSWQLAMQRVGNLNTIALLTFHINYYLKGLLRFFESGELEIKDRYSFDIPPIKSGNDWNNLVNDLLMNAEQFAAAVANLPDEKFDEIFLKEQSGTWLRNIEGILEHSYYHLGQITLLKKIITKTEEVEPVRKST